jgi:hypothetical protein
LVRGSRLTTNGRSAALVIEMVDIREIDFNGVDEAASDPRGEREHLRIMAQIDKTFQIWVLLIFVVSTLLIFILDGIYFYFVRESLFIKIMAITTPVFTLVLGIGTNVRSY